MREICDDDGNLLAVSIEARPEDLTDLMQATEGDLDGRSAWQWVRLANGDLMLACYPHGDTYERFTQRFGMI